jgi:transcriptional regulator with XRE-family HTH domain
MPSASTSKAPADASQGLSVSTRSEGYAGCYWSGAGNAGIDRAPVDPKRLSKRDREALSLFVDEMTAAREQRGWTQADLAREANYSESLVGMVETYRRAPTRALALALDKAFGTPDTFRRLEARLRNLPFPAAFRPFAQYESEAVALSIFEHSVVPGLLQTVDYMRAVLGTRPNTTEDEIEDLVSGRLARQLVLTRDDPPAPQVWALIDEGALHRPVAPPAAMHDQLSHLVAMSHRPNVTVQVIPYTAGGHIGLIGAFTIADRGAGPSIVNVEDIADGRVIEDAPTVSVVALRFTSLRDDALPRGASRDLIASVAERWTQTP